MLREINRIFKQNGIKKAEGFLHEYISKKKVVVFVPLSHTDKLTFEMAAAGAGAIGNYRLCSFRMKGLGTYKPVKNANPYIGKPGEISFKEEVRLEMECDESKLNPVIDAMLANHPYEEVAYEVYDFKKRSKAITGYFIELKKSITEKDLIICFQKKIHGENLDLRKKIKKISIVKDNITPDIILKSKSAGCQAIISLNKIFTTIKII